MFCFICLCLRYSFIHKNTKEQTIAKLRLVAWRYKYLIETERYHSKVYLFVYLDETWFDDSHDTVHKLWSNSSNQCAVSGQPSRGKRIVICHAGSSEGLVSGALLLCG